MTIERISNAFDDAGLKVIFVDDVFAVEFDADTMTVLMGVASAP